MIATCDTCRWWKKWQDVASHHPAAGHCESPKCSMGRDNAAHSSRMFTGPKFGCIHHEAEAYSLSVKTVEAAQ